MRLISYNINDARTNYKGLKNFLFKKTKKYDLILLQETYYKFFKINFFKKGLDLTAVSSSKTETKENSKFHNTTIFNNLFLKLKNTEDPLINVKKTGCALTTIFSYKGKKLQIINVHGSPYPGTKLDTTSRLIQTQKILRQACSLKMPTIIAGDFNLLPQTKSVLNIEKQGFKNLIKEFDIKTTRNEVSWNRYPEKEKQYFADYIFVSKCINVLNFEVPYNEYSDHLPMILDFEIK